MLYNSFRATLLISAALGLIHMISIGFYLYSFFPIAIIVWALYSFFDENDREYLRRNGIDPDEISWFFPDYDDYGAVRSNHHIQAKSYPTRDYTRYMPKNKPCGTIVFNSEYKALKDKCKRNFKITISKNEEIET